MWAMASQMASSLRWAALRSQCLSFEKNISMGLGEMLLREYSECVFNLANGAFFYDIVDDVEWHYARHLVRPADTNLDEMESDCVRLWNGSDIDCLCLLPLSWGSSGMFERFIKFDRTVEQVNKALTHALYRKFCANRHILEEALFELEVEQLESADMDFPSAYQ